MKTNVSIVTDNLSDRLFDENHMYTFLRGYLAAKQLWQSMRMLPYVKEKHAGQDRKGKDRVPYFSHPLHLACHAAALGLDEDDLISAALLHDVCEDCNVTVGDLPVNEATRAAVALLTKSGFPECPVNGTSEEEEEYKIAKELAEGAYYGALRSNRIATIVKLLDRCHNLSSMATVWPPEHLASYILETEEYVYPLLEFAKNNYPQYTCQVFLIKYHMRSVVEAIRHMLATRNK